MTLIANGVTTRDTMMRSEYLTQIARRLRAFKPMSVIVPTRAHERSCQHPMPNTIAAAPITTSRIPQTWESSLLQLTPAITLSTPVTHNRIDITVTPVGRFIPHSFRGPTPANCPARTERHTPRPRWRRFDQAERDKRPSRATGTAPP